MHGVAVHGVTAWGSVRSEVGPRCAVGGQCSAGAVYRMCRLATCCFCGKGRVMRWTRRDVLWRGLMVLLGSWLVAAPFDACRKAGKTSDFVTIRATEYAFTPASLSAHVGQTVRIRFENHGSLQHNFVIDNVIWSVMVDPGKTVELEFTAPNQPGDYPYYCAVPGHRELGMQGMLHVTPS